MPPNSQLGYGNASWPYVMHGADIFFTSLMFLIILQMDDKTQLMPIY